MNHRKLCEKHFVIMYHANTIGRSHCFATHSPLPWKRKCTDKLYTPRCTKSYTQMHKIIHPDTHNDTSRCKGDHLPVYKFSLLLAYSLLSNTLYQVILYHLIYC
jgi:hypothetical protein